MGTYTYMDSSDLTITDLEGLKKHIEQGKRGENFFIFKEKKLNPITKTTEIIEKEMPIEDFHYTDKHRIQIDEKNLSIEIDIDAMKIIGYYYESFMAWLQQLALFIEGTIELTCEDGNKARFIFENKEFYFEEGVMQWKTITPEILNEDFRMPNELEEFKRKSKLLDKV